jgi:hypothetical protein
MRGRSQPQTTHWLPAYRCLDHTTTWTRTTGRCLDGGRDELQVREKSTRWTRRAEDSDVVTSGTRSGDAEAGTFDRRAGVHHDVEACRSGALSRCLVDDTELKPHGAGTDRDGLVDDRASER